MELEHYIDAVLAKLNTTLDKDALELAFEAEEHFDEAIASVLALTSLDNVLRNIQDAMYYLQNQLGANSWEELSRQWSWARLEYENEDPVFTLYEICALIKKAEEQGFSPKQIIDAISSAFETPKSPILN